MTENHFFFSSLEDEEAFGFGRAKGQTWTFSLVISAVFLTLKNEI